MALTLVCIQEKEDVQAATCRGASIKFLSNTKNEKYLILHSFRVSPNVFSSYSFNLFFVLLRIFLIFLLLSLYSILTEFCNLTEYYACNV